MPLVKSCNIPPSAATFSMKDIENQAKLLILRARQQAELLITEAQKQAEHLRKAAMEQGQRQGYAQGIKEGTEAGKKSAHDQALNENRAGLTKLTQALTGALNEFDKQRRALETEATGDVVELAMSIARRVTKRQAEIDPGVLSGNLSEAMKLVVHAADLRVIVHPEQKQTLLKELPNLQMQWPALEHVELIEDGNLSPGGCRIVSRQGVIDADLDKQLDRLMANLLPPKAENR